MEHLTPFEKLGAILAAVCHDLDHPGVNQAFLVATDNHLASLYNVSSAFLQLLRVVCICCVLYDK